MNPPNNSSFTINGAARNPVNELLAAVMRSFGEEPSASRDVRITKAQGDRAAQMQNADRGLRNTSTDSGNS